MDREYEIFEKFPDGFPVWRGYASGLVNAAQKLAEIAKQTTNECFVVRLPSKEVVARLNVRDSGRSKKHRVCQISYEPQLGSERAAVLRRSGYEVISAFGNDAARIILSTTEQPCHAFIVGHGASQEQRREMLLWLKERFPTSRVIVMNGPGINPLPGADYNVKLNGPENLLPVIETALGGSSGVS